MNTEKLLGYFRRKLEEMPELYSLSAGNARFKSWWKSIETTCSRMGQDYLKRANDIHFHPMVYSMYGTTDYAKPYSSGLDNAKVFLEALIEELENWGYENDNNIDKAPRQKNKEKGQVTLNLTITQQQSQQIAQTINLSQYDEDVQEKVQELLEELKKKKKSKSKISDLIKWLADKGIDAMIAIMLASVNLT